MVSTWLHVRMSSQPGELQIPCLPRTLPGGERGGFTTLLCDVLSRGSFILGAAASENDRLEQPQLLSTKNQRTCRHEFTFAAFASAWDFASRGDRSAWETRRRF